MDVAPQLHATTGFSSNASHSYSTDDSWDLCFHSAASLGAINSIEGFILNHHIDVDQRNQDTWTALMYASYYGHEDIVTCLLQRGVQKNAANINGHTSLMLAAMCGHASIVTKLLERNCAIELRDTQGWTALFHATHTGYDHIVKLLLRNEAEVNCVEHKYGFTPLMIASKEGLEIIVDIFLERGADISLNSYAGETARSLAFIHGHMKVVALIDRHVHISAKDKVSELPFLTISPASDLKSLLEKIGLSKYYHVFEEQDIDLPIFLTLTDEDLKEIGIKLLGPRKKIFSAITRWQNKAVIGNSVECAYADRLAFGLKIANAKLALAQKEIDHLKSEHHKARKSHVSAQAYNQPCQNNLDSVITDFRMLNPYIKHLQHLLHEWHTNYLMRCDSSSFSDSMTFYSTSKNDTINYKADILFKEILECISTILSKYPPDTEQ